MSDTSIMETIKAKLGSPGETELKAMNLHLLISSTLTWVFIAGYFIIRFIL
jgi:hypothetical protein